SASRPTSGSCPSGVARLVLVDGEESVQRELRDLLVEIAVRDAPVPPATRHDRDDRFDVRGLEALDREADVVSSDVVSRVLDRLPEGVDGAVEGFVAV